MDMNQPQVHRIMQIHWIHFLYLVWIQDKESQQCTKCDSSFTMLKRRVEILVSSSYQLMTATVSLQKVWTSHLFNLFKNWICYRHSKTQLDLNISAYLMHLQLKCALTVM